MNIVIGTHYFDIPQTKSISLEKVITTKGLNEETKKNVKKATELRDLVVKCLGQIASSNVNMSTATSTSHSSSSNSSSAQAATAIANQLKLSETLKNKLKYTIVAIESYLPYLHTVMQLTSPSAQVSVSTSSPSTSSPGLSPSSASSTGSSSRRSSTSTSYSKNVFSWTSGLIQVDKPNNIFTSTLTRKKFTSSNDLKFECIMMLYSYVYTMCNYVSHCSSLKNCQNRDDYDDEMRESCAYLRKATGVLEFILFELLQFDYNNSSTEIVFKSNSPLIPELNKNTCESLIYYCKGIAQLIAIQATNLSELSVHTNILARMSVKAYQLFDSCRSSIVEVLNGTNSSKFKLTESYRILTAQYRVLYRGIALYYHAIESSKSEQCGLSVAVISTACKQLQEMNVFSQLQLTNGTGGSHSSSGSGSSHAKNSTNDIELLSLSVKDAYVEAKRLEQKYERENRTVFREPIPELEQVIQSLPDGVVILKSVPFKLSSD